ncbi:MAG: hypothetical protein WDN04_25570 [Rhodospirillales bacterium]
MTGQAAPMRQAAHMVAAGRDIECHFQAQRPDERHEFEVLAEPVWVETRYQSEQPGQQARGCQRRALQRVIPQREAPVAPQQRVYQHGKRQRREVGRPEAQHAVGEECAGAAGIKACQGLGDDEAADGEE